MMRLNINVDQFLEIEKLCLGVFLPLRRFMHQDDFHSCTDRMRLSSGEVFTIPIFLDVSCEEANQLKDDASAELFFEGKKVARIKVDSIYRPDKEKVCLSVFGTTDLAHPGVAYYRNCGEFFIGGDVEMYERPNFEFSNYELTPAEMKSYFSSQGWKNVVGFQTRNIPHNAHEYLQKIALEVVDGILIQPIVGKKKKGDFTPNAIIAGYNALIKNYYPENRVKLAVLSTIMRYAGPREAIFHAIIRRNYGCTHFIVGRDHAGVGSYYDKYAGHRLAEKFESEIGIQILKLNGPYLCNHCGGIVTSKTCPHQSQDSNACFEISGSYIREQLRSGTMIDAKVIRPEVVNALKGLKVFI